MRTGSRDRTVKDVRTEPRRKETDSGPLLEDGDPQPGGGAPLGQRARPGRWWDDASSGMYDVSKSEAPGPSDGGCRGGGLLGPPPDMRAPAYVPVVGDLRCCECARTRYPDRPPPTSGRPRSWPASRSGVGPTPRDPAGKNADRFLSADVVVLERGIRVDRTGPS